MSSFNNFENDPKIILKFKNDVIFSYLQLLWFSLNFFLFFTCPRWQLTSFNTPSYNNNNNKKLNLKLPTVKIREANEREKYKNLIFDWFIAHTIITLKNTTNSLLRFGRRDRLRIVCARRKRAIFGCLLVRGLWDKRVRERTSAECWMMDLKFDWFWVNLMVNLSFIFFNDSK
jgi:hypothetical protein